MDHSSTTRVLSSAEIVERYLSFFRTHGHSELPRTPLVVPENSTSFIIAGMQPLLPYLRGQQLPPAPRLTSYQRCLRTDDIEAVGTNGRKLTFFHMLGNWSVNDYGRREAIALALELLNNFGLDVQTLWVTTYMGDPTAGLPPDEAVIEEWLQESIPRERIVPLGEDNFWTMGSPGPCGPCSEIYVDRGVDWGCGLPTCQPGCRCDRFLEIWNLVFIEYEWLPDGSYVPLPLRSVDTGLGLERLAAVLQSAESVFSIDLFASAGQRLAESMGISVPSMSQDADGLDKRQSSPETLAQRRIVDHVRSVLFAGLAGVQPGRDGRSSVVRRLIRRAARQGRVLGIEGPFLSTLVPLLVEAHQHLLTAQECLQADTMMHMIADEEKRFERVLTQGLRWLAELGPDERGVVPGERLFTLQAERGFPSDLAAEIVAERGLTVDWSSYDSALEAHRAVSRVSAERRFRGA